jgi:glycosyltransferase involved in cell wall biosynthesis
LVLANSERTRRDLIERLGLDGGRVRTVYYGVDPHCFRPIGAAERAAVREKMGWPLDRPLAVFVGALGDRRKGFDTLFAAWGRLCSRPDWDVDLVVIGSGVELPAWQSRAREAGLAERIRFLGFRRDVPELLPACDVLAAPTRYEAYGLGVHEALCCGLSAFVSRSAGVAERYPEELSGLLLDDPEDAADLASRLREWREQREFLGGAVLRLSERLRAYTWEHMARRIVELTESTG